MAMPCKGRARGGSKGKIMYEEELIETVSEHVTSAHFSIDSTTQT